MKTTARNGKIAHLPHGLREDLNQRLHDGIPGHKILAWLNAEPDTQRILAEYYPGQCITQQNLSVWRQGGYQDWVKLQRRDELILALAQDPEAIDLGISPKKITESMATIAIAEFARASQEKSRECITADERWKHCRQVQSELSRFREDSRRADVAALQKEQWDYQVAADQRTTQKAAEAKVRQELLTELNRIMKRLPKASEAGMEYAKDASPLERGSVTRSNIQTLQRLTSYKNHGQPSTKTFNLRDDFRFIQNPSACHVAAGHRPALRQKPTEIAHFPSGTKRNHALNISSPSTPPTVPAKDPRSPQPAASNHPPIVPTLDLSLPLPISLDRPITHITGACGRHAFKAPTV